SLSLSFGHRPSRRAHPCRGPLHRASARRFGDAGGRLPERERRRAPARAAAGAGRGPRPPSHALARDEMPALVDTLLRASIEGAMMAIGLWLVIQLAPGMPPRVRVWLWWLVTARLLLALAPVPAIEVPWRVALPWHD